LAVADYGTYAFALSVIGVLIASSALGLPQSIIYHLGKNELAFKEIASAIVTLWIVLSVLFFAIVLLFADKILTIFSGLNNQTIIILILIIFIIKLLDYFFIAFLRAYKHFSFYNIKRILESVLFVLIIVFAIIFSQQDVSDLLFIYLIVSFFSVGVLLFFIYRKKFEPVGKFEFKLSVFNRLITFGSKSYIQNLTGFLNYQISILVLAYLMNTWNIGIFAVGLSIASMVLFIPDTIGIVLLPHLTSKRDDSDIHQTTALIIRNVTFVLCLGIVLFLIIGKFIIYYFYGIDYMPSYYPMLIMLPGMLFLGLYKMLTRNFTSRNKQHYTIIVTMTTLITNILLNFILIKPWGIYGAVFSSTFSFFLAGIFLLSIFKKESGFLYRDILFIKREDFDVYKKLILDYKTKSVEI
jgi:O-antigen/teichoic acid export membrane protein